MASWISTRTARFVAGKFSIFRACPFITTDARCAISSSQRLSTISRKRISYGISTTKNTLLILDYQEARPRGNAATLCQLFSAARPRRILDYGGGNGVLADLLRAAGFSQVDTYDPFVPRYSAKPPDRFDCIVSFEVVEHAADPARVFADMNDLLTDSGLILLSTLLQPTDIDQQGLNWWYAGPRNGHVSLFSRASLAKVVEPFGFKLGSFNDALHVLFREDLREPARHFIKL